MMADTLSKTDTDIFNEILGNGKNGYRQTWRRRDKDTK